MKYQEVGTTVTNDDDHLRLRIYLGEIPLSEAGAEKVRYLQLELARANERTRKERMRADRAELVSELTRSTPLSRLWKRLQSHLRIERHV